MAQISIRYSKLNTNSVITESDVLQKDTFTECSAVTPVKRWKFAFKAVLVFYKYYIRSVSISACSASLISPCHQHNRQENSNVWQLAHAAAAAAAAEWGLVQAIVGKEKSV